MAVSKYHVERVSHRLFIFVNVVVIALNVIDPRLQTQTHAMIYVAVALPARTQS
jgi:hypothetical protein